LAFFSLQEGPDKDATLVYILDENKTVLAAKGALPGLNAADINRLLVDVAQLGITQTRLKEQSYSVNQVISDASGWSFVTIMPTKQFLERVIQMRTFVVVILLFVILIGIAAAVVLSRRTYRPIRTLGARNERLVTQIDAQRPMMREHFLLKMLRGVWTDDEEIAGLMKIHGMEMSGPFFFVMLVSLGERRKDITAAQHVNIEKALEKVHFPEGGVGYGVELVHDNVFALAINLAGGELELKDKQKETAYTIIKLMKKIGIRVPNVSIGRRYLYSKHYNRSFIEASVAKKYEVPGEFERLLFFDEIKPLQDQVSWYPLGDQVKLAQSLKQGDAAVALETLRTILGSIAAKEQSILLLKCMGYDVVNTVFKTLGEMRITEYFPRIKSLLEFQSLEQLEEQLTSLIVDICEQVNHARDNRQAMLGNEILDYIDRHYRSYELSLEQVADQFNLSVSYIGRLLKEQTGETFTEYVARLRMDEVKRALVATDQPTKDIIVSVGLLDASNFIRKFRKSEGITPGEFRRRAAGP
jgi:AraC-like DNA-binding protein